MEQVYASIDIGSDTIKLVVCELYKNHLNLLAASCTPSLGIKKGLIVNPALARQSIKKAFDEVQQMLGVKIKKVIASIPSYQSELKIVKSNVNVSNDLITAEDINNVYKKAIIKNLKGDMEYITMVPIDFIINDKNQIKDPKNFPGSKLTSRSVMVTVPKKNLYSVASIIESLGIELIDVSVDALGDISALNNEKIKNSFGTIINIGSEKTTVNLYNKGIFMTTNIVNIGGKSIDEDIAYMYKLDMDEARKIKEKFALASINNADKNEIYETINKDKEKVVINQIKASEIVSAKFEEIISLAKNQIKDLTNREIQYIIITGGSSNALDLDLLLRDIFGSKASLGNIKLIGVRNNMYSVALGNIIHFINTLKLKGQKFTMLDKEDMEVLSSADRHFLHTSNDTMLGKVFGYFFGE